MVDAVTVIKALRRGYSILPDADDNHWVYKEGEKLGPYKNMDEAALAALDHFELQLAFSFLEKHNGQY